MHVLHFYHNNDIFIMFKWLCIIVYMFLKIQTYVLKGYQGAAPEHLIVYMLKASNIRFKRIAGHRTRAPHRLKRSISTNNLREQ